MSKIDPKRAGIFIGVFSFIAIAETAAWDRWKQHSAWQEQQQQLAVANQTAAQRATQEAAAEHANYLARYLNSGVARAPGTKAIALMAMSEDSRPNQALNAAVASRFRTEPVQILTSFFKPEFASDGLLNDAFGDAKEIFRKLEIAKSIDALLLARQTVQYSTNRALENVITATTELEVAVFPADSNSKGRTWRFKAVGSGFKQEGARMMAEERLIKQIVGDTQMSLASVLTTSQNQ